MNFTPGYVRLMMEGRLLGKVRDLREMLTECRLCGHRCGVDRTAGEKGLCGAGMELEVASACLHRGEEPVLTGEVGVGNVFLGRCSLSCVYCQNHAISQPGKAETKAWHTTEDRLADILMGFQESGCPTAGFVSPTHFAPQIVGALETAARRGFRLPVIYNSGGYDSLELLEALDGVFDIYMPDFKYRDGTLSKKYSGAGNYPRVAMECLKEMHRQVGDLRVNSGGVAYRGLLVRHLVLPGGISGSLEVLEFIARELGTDVFISLMSQYYPAHSAKGYPPLDRGLEPGEYEAAVEALESLGFQNGWIQDPVTSPESYRPGVDFEIQRE